MSDVITVENLGEKYTFTQRRKEKQVTENRIAEIIVDACFKINTILGPGLLESVYGKILI
jgi:hypothetical protein